MTECRVLVAEIVCPECGFEFEGTWAEPADREEVPEPAFQLCPGRGHIFEAEYPGYSFRTEAG